MSDDKILEFNGWLPIADFLKRVGVSERTLYRKKSKGEVEARTEGGRMLWRVVEGAKPEAPATPPASVVHDDGVSIAIGVLREQLTEERRRADTARAEARDEREGFAVQMRHERERLDGHLASFGEQLAGIRESNRLERAQLTTLVIDANQNQAGLVEVIGGLREELRQANEEVRLNQAMAALKSMEF